MLKPGNSFTAPLSTMIGMQIPSVVFLENAAPDQNASSIELVQNVGGELSTDLGGEMQAADVVAVLIEAADREKGVVANRAGDLSVEAPLAVIGDANLTDAMKHVRSRLGKYVDGNADLAVGQHLCRAAAHRLDMVNHLVDADHVSIAEPGNRRRIVDRRPGQLERDVLGVTAAGKAADEEVVALLAAGRSHRHAGNTLQQPSGIQRRELVNVVAAERTRRKRGLLALDTLSAGGRCHHNLAQWC